MATTAASPSVSCTAGRWYDGADEARSGAVSGESSKGRPVSRTVFSPWTNEGGVRVNIDAHPAFPPSPTVRLSPFCAQDRAWRYPRPQLTMYPEKCGFVDVKVHESVLTVPFNSSETRPPVLLSRLGSR